MFFILLPVLFMQLINCSLAYPVSGLPYELVRQSADNVVWYQSTAFFVVVSCGLVIIFFIIGILTNRHLALEHLVDVRTAELQKVYGENIQYETEMKIIASELCSSEERVQRRIGQDLHNDLVQYLTGIGMLMQSLQKRLVDKSLPEADEVGRLIRMLSETVEKTRDLAKILSPLALESLGLIGALQELILEIQGLYGIECHFEYDSTNHVYNSDVRNHLYRIAQEAMVNAGRHAQATALWITHKQVDEDLIISVRDNGIGMPDHNQNRDGLGLRSMRYRCTLINADLNIRSSASEGTEIVCTIKTRYLNPTDHDIENSNEEETSIDC